MKRFLLIPVTLVIIGVLVVLTRLFSIQKVECLTQFGVCSDALLEPANYILGRSLLLPLPITSIQTTYKSKVEIKSMEFLKKFPDTFQIMLSIREPIGAVDSNLTGSSALLVDSSGVVLGPVNDQSLPLLIISDFDPELKSISQNYVLALISMQKIDQLTNSRIVGSLENTILTVTYINGPKIIIDIGDNVDRWYFPLQQVLERSKITSKSPSKIDLRFKDPVLTY